MSGSGGSTDTSSERDPWEEAVPYLTDIFSEAETLYNSGSGTEDYTGDTVADLSTTLTDAFSDAQATADSLPSLTSTIDEAISSVTSNGISDQQQDQLDVLSSVSSGDTSITTGDEYNSLYNTALTQNDEATSVMEDLATGTSDLDTLASNYSGSNDTYSDVLTGIATDDSQTAAAQYLTDMAANGGVNPYLQSVMDDLAARMSNRVNSAMSGAGRYGSFGHADLLNQSIASAINPLALEAYNEDQNRRITAANSIDASNNAQDNTQISAATSGADINQEDTSLLASIYDSDTDNTLAAATSWADTNNEDSATALAALTGQTDVESENIDNQTSAATDSLTAQQNAEDTSATWASLLDELYSASFTGSDNMAEIGEYLTNYDQSEIDALMESFDSESNESWEQLANYLSTITGTSGLTGTSGSTSGTSETDASWSSLAGLSASTLAALLSDPDEKTDKRKIGVDEDTGLTIWSYRYKGDPKTYPKMVGPMADEIEEKYPDAVVEVGGRLAVKEEYADLLIPHSGGNGLLGA